MQNPKRQGTPWAMILLFAMFLVPTGIAWTLFFTGWRPATTANHGELVTPPHRLQGELQSANGESMAMEELRGRWTILIRSLGPCEAECLERVQQTSQVRQALAQNRDRVQRVLVLPMDAPLPNGEIGSAHADLQIYRSDDPLLPEDSAQRDMPLHVSLQDTRGYRMLSYAEPLDAGGMLQDMKKLLKISNIDIERLQGLSGDD